MRKGRIFTPGPTPLLPETQLAMARPIIHHRTAEFRDLFSATLANLKRLFRTENDVVILACTGTGAMEAAVGNLLGPSDVALAVVAGKFGERWTQICRSCQVPCVPICKEPGLAATADEICRKLGEDDRITALLIQGCETSTATAHDLRNIGQRLAAEFPKVFTVVDAITAVGCQPLESDEWGLDVVIGGSQKSLAMPPGLAFLSISSRALERMRKKEARGFYFDLVKETEAQRRGQSAYTSAVSLVDGLHSATHVILEQGLDQIVAEAELMSRCTRAGLSALGFQMLSASPANAVTAAFPPPEVSAEELRGRLEQKFALKVAGGQGELKGKIIRIAHLGYFDLLDVFSVLSAIELCLVETGTEVETGAALRAAMEVAASDGN